MLIKKQIKFSPTYLPIAHAVVSRTTTLSSFNNEMKSNIPSSTIVVNLSVPGPSSMDPNAMTAASLYLQSRLLMLAVTNGTIWKFIGEVSNQVLSIAGSIPTWGNTSSSHRLARSMIHTPAAFDGFQSSSSSNSSYK